MSKKPTEQQQLSKNTGIAQSHISTYLREIKQGHIIRPNILKILRVQGKGELIDAFIKAVQNA